MNTTLTAPLLSLFLSVIPLAQGAPESKDEGWTPLTATRGPEPRNDSWQPIDGIVAVAGERAITQSRIKSFVDQRRAVMNITTRDEYEKALGDALRALVTLELESQAGRELGLDPEQVRRMVRVSVEEQKIEMGAVKVSESLRASGYDAVDALSREVDQLYTSLWRRSIQGLLSKDSGIRPHRDRFVRPGELREIYRINRVGPTGVTLQVLDIKASQTGGLEAAKEYIEDLRQQVLDGEDLGLLVVENAASNREQRGLTGAIQADLIPFPPLREFAEKGEVGGLSEVIPVIGADGGAGFLFARLIDRQQPEEAPPFLDRTLQQNLRRLYSERRDDSRLGRARSDLGRQAYLWPDQGDNSPAAGR